jgi:Concanavalin A-like lectin/glucanases superfamily
MLPGTVPALMGGGPSGNDMNTVVLLHGNGAQDSTVFTDDAKAAPGKTWITPNAAKIYNPCAGAFGGAAMGFNGTSSFAYTSNIGTLNFGAVDWTIDVRIYLLELKPGAYESIVAVANAAVTAHDMFFTFNNYTTPGTPRLTCAVYTGSATVTIEANWSPALNTWYHVAAQRSGNTISLFVNGVLLTSGAFSGTIEYNGPNFCIAASNNGQFNFFSGFMDELRVSIGKARYSGNFIPPTTPYGP